MDIIVGILASIVFLGMVGIALAFVLAPPPSPRCRREDCDTEGLHVHSSEISVSAHFANSGVSEEDLDRLFSGVKDNRKP